MLHSSIIFLPFAKKYGMISDLENRAPIRMTRRRKQPPCICPFYILILPLIHFNLFYRAYDDAMKMSGSKGCKCDSMELSSIEKGKRTLECLDDFEIYCPSVSGLRR